MPAIVQICAVIVTMALVAVAIATLRAMTSFEKAAAEMSRTATMARHSITQIQEITREFRGITGSLGSHLPRIRSIASRFETVGERTSNLSKTVLEEVEAPVRSAVAVVSGLRAGTARFFRAASRRPPQHQTPTNGGVGHE